MNKPLTPYQPPTIRDVARLAGVSIGTVSKALSGKGQLREETRTHIRQVAEQLAFEPNDLAQSLHRQRTLTVGLISTDSYGRFSMPLVEGLQGVLGAAQFNVFLCNAADDPQRERQHIRSLLSKRVDGIIVTSRRTDPRPPLDLGGAGVPVVYAYTQVELSRGAVCLLPDDEGGGALAVLHLLSLGHTNIAHVTGPQRFLAVRDRVRGATAALQSVGLDLPHSHILYGPWSEEWGYQAAAQLLSLGVSAVFCGNDQIARGVVDALRELGASVPQNMAVVGFDNWEVMAAATRPPLTSVDMNLHELGRRAGMRLLGLIDPGLIAPSSEQPLPTSEPERLPCRLVIRASCGAQAATTQAQAQGVGIPP